jgi:hypothetical protein
MPPKPPPPMYPGQRGWFVVRRVRGGPVPQSPPPAQPLFSDEGPAYYAAAYQHNRPFARPSTTGYQTRLTPGEEQAFRAWLHQNRVPFDPDAGVVDYDMRGFWKSGRPIGREPDGSMGFEDTFKTPYDTTFSNESMYAMPGTPFVWHGNNLVDLRNGQLIFRR